MAHLVQMYNFADDSNSKVVYYSFCPIWVTETSHMTCCLTTKIYT